MQSFVRSTLSSTLQRIHFVAENFCVRHASVKNGLAEVIPKKPKKPKSALKRFLCDLQPQLQAENPNFSRQEMKVIAREMWQDLNPEAKRSYKEEAQREAEEYTQQYQLYICSLSDDESATRLLKAERRRLASSRRALSVNLLETGKPLKPTPRFALFLADLKAKYGVNNFTTLQEYQQWVKSKWDELSEEEKGKYTAKVMDNVKLYKEQVSQWTEKIEERFSKWDDIQAIATKKKTMTDFGRPVQSPSAFMLFMDDMKFEEHGGEKSRLDDYISKWKKLDQQTKDEYVVEAQKLHDDYVKELDQWNKRMNETVGPWASKIPPQRS